MEGYGVTICVETTNANTAPVLFNLILQAGRGERSRVNSQKFTAWYNYWLVGPMQPDSPVTIRARQTAAESKRL